MACIDIYYSGKDNYAADRHAVREVLKAAPEVRDSARANRAFLQRAVRFLAGEAGIRQIIDVGTGIPAAGNVHEVAAQVVAGARVAYVDNDPIVHVHANALLTGSGTTSIVLADLRDPEAILAHPKVAALIDFTQPVALLLVAIVHFITDQENPARILGVFRDALPTGSYLALSHATGDFRLAAARQAAAVRPGHLTGDLAHPRAGRRVLRRLGPGRTGPGPGSAVAAGRQTAPATGTGTSLDLRRSGLQEHMTAERSHLSPVRQFIRPNDPWFSPWPACQVSRLRGGQPDPGRLCKPTVMASRPNSSICSSSVRACTEPRKIGTASSVRTTVSRASSGAIPCAGGSVRTGSSAETAASSAPERSRTAANELG